MAQTHRHIGSGECPHHRASDAALGVVVLDHYQPAVGRPRGGHHRRLIHRLDRVEVDHPCCNAFGRECLRSRQALVQGDAGADEGDYIGVRPARHLRAPDGEGLVRTVDHRVGTTSRTQVADPVEIGHDLNKLGRAGRVTGIQDGRTVHRPHHRKIFQCHLGRTVRADLDTRMRTRQPDVRL